MEGAALRLQGHVLSVGRWGGGGRRWCKDIESLFPGCLWLFKASWEDFEMFKASWEIFRATCVHYSERSVGRCAVRGWRRKCGSNLLTPTLSILGRLDTCDRRARCRLGLRERGPVLGIFFLRGFRLQGFGFGGQPSSHGPEPSTTNPKATP